MRNKASCVSLLFSKRSRDHETQQDLTPSGKDAAMDFKRKTFCFQNAIEVTRRSGRERILERYRSWGRTRAIACHQ
jgi:hypothetical protein